MSSTPPADGTAIALDPVGIPLLDLLRESLEPTEWVIQDILPMGETVLLYGPQHSGKTFAIIDIAHAVFTGRSWHGYPVPEARAVVYVPSEGRRGIGRRFAASLAAHSPDISLDHPFTLWPHPLDLSGKDGGASLRDLGRHIKREYVGLLVVDVLSDFAPEVEENSREFGHALGRLRTLSQQLGCAVIGVHHSGKDPSKGSRGHSSLDATADIIIRVTATETKSPDGTLLATAVRLANLKNRNEDRWPDVTLHLAKVHLGGRDLGPAVIGLWVGGTPADADRIERALILDAVRNLAATGREVTRHAIEDATGKGRTFVAEAARDLTAAGLLIEETGDKNRKTYHLPERAAVLPSATSGNTATADRGAAAAAAPPRGRKRQQHGGPGIAPHEEEGLTFDEWLTRETPPADDGPIDLDALEEVLGRQETPPPGPERPIGATPRPEV